MVNTLYFPYKIDSDINYLYLFRLMRLAEYNTTTKSFDTLRFSSLSSLAGQIDISSSTLKRILSKPTGDYKKDYSPFFSCDLDKKIIVFNNNFIGQKKVQYIYFMEQEVSFLLKHNDNLLCQYLIYLKYNCSRVSNKGQDFTANQFLNACGYSTKSSNTKSKISSYNELLERNGFIKISRFRDSQGYNRNNYTYNSYYLVK